jgi:hypothetical protein
MAFAARACLAAASIAAATPACAQSDDKSASASFTGYYQFNTTLDAGGRFNWGGGIARASLTRPLSQQLSADLDLRYEYQSWRWHEPVAFGNEAAWNNVNAPSIAVNFDYAYAQDLVLSLKPQVEWDYESGANTGDALTWGAVAAVTKVFSPSLALGVGLSAFRRIDKTQVLPFPIVNWQINDKWRIANPFDAGPAGGAGIEAIYSPNERWEIAEGVTYRSYRFRLATDNHTPSGVGENSFIPIFVRVTRKLTKDARIDFYGAITTYGKASVDYENGNGRYHDDYNIGPALAASFVLQF